MRVMAGKGRGRAPYRVIDHWSSRAGGAVAPRPSKRREAGGGTPDARAEQRGYVGVGAWLGG